MQNSILDIESQIPLITYEMYIIRDPGRGGSTLPHRIISGKDKTIERPWLIVCIFVRSNSAILANSMFGAETGPLISSMVRIFRAQNLAGRLGVGFHCNSHTMADIPT